MANGIIWIFIVVLLPSAILPLGSCELDFSQFYLPPCCYILPHVNSFTGYSLPLSRASVNTKRDISSQMKMPIVKSNTKTFVSSSKLIQLKNGKKLNLPDQVNQKFNIYKLVIPLDEILVKSTNKTTTVASTTQLPETTQMKPPTMGYILLPEIRNVSLNVTKFKRDSNLVLSKSKLLEAVINLELEGAESQKSFVGKKSLENDEILYDDKMKPEHRSFNKENSSISLNMNSIKSNSKPNSKDHHDLDDLSTNIVKRQVARKVPTSWSTNLRRALYQSLTAVDRSPMQRNPSKQNEPKDLQQLTMENIMFPETWNNIQNANIQYVNKMAQVSPHPNEIFLPRGEGPVASGVLVNAGNSGLQIRVATELHNPNQSNGRTNQNGCNCYLLNPGEILIAYWSVIRVFNPQGRPALQYLVYPLPYSVPTPPELNPLNIDPMFLASPIDPFTNVYENSHKNQHFVEQPITAGYNSNQFDDNTFPEISGTGPSANQLRDNFPGGPHGSNLNSNYLDNRIPESQINGPNHLGNNFPEQQITGPSPNYVGNNNIPGPGINNLGNNFLGPSPNHFPNIPRERHPKLIHDLPNGHHRLEIHDHSHQPQPSPMPPGFTQIPQQGVLIENNQQYTPEFMDLYRKAVLNHFQNEINPNNLLQQGGGTPYPHQEDINMLNIPFTGPPNQGLLPPDQGFLPPDQGFLPPSIPTQFVNPGNEEVQQRPILLPTNPGPTGLSIQNDQISKPPTFPKSIQEIIAPDGGFYLPPEQPISYQTPQQVPIGPTKNSAETPSKQIGPTIQQQVNEQQGEEGVRPGEAYPPLPNPQFHSTQRPSFNTRNSNKPNCDKSQDEYNTDRDRPYIVSNVLDNEKKYYPRRKPQIIEHTKNYNVRNNDYRSYSRRPIQHIDDKRGYILNF